MKEKSQRIFGNWVLRKTSGSKRNKLTGNAENCIISKLHDLKSSPNTVRPGYNDIDLYDTSYTTLHTLWYQLIPHCQP